MQRLRITKIHKWLWIICSSSIVSTCKQVEITNSRRLNAPSKPLPAPQSADIESQASTPSHANFAMPLWCSLSQKPDQYCFKCQRQENNVAVDYEQCATPPDNFQASRDCRFNDAITKSIFCEGSTTTDPLKMDISLASEKIIVSSKAFLRALSFTVAQNNGDVDKIAPFIDELTTLINDRMPQVLSGVDRDAAADELVALVNRHLKVPMADTQSKNFKSSTLDVFTIYAKDIVGRKDYSLVQFIKRALALGSTIPASNMGPGRALLSGPELAGLVGRDQSNAFILGYLNIHPHVHGFTSIEDLIAQLKNSN